MKFLAITLAAVLPAVLAQNMTDIPPATGVSAAPSQVTDPTTLCHAHGDHWHCPSGVPEPTTPPAPETDDHDDHDHTATGSEDPGPSPTESVGCEPHGDHWHCDGPRSTGAVATPTTGESAPASTAAGATMGVYGGLVAGALAAGAFVL
ncbi:hypothetical protein EJ05DRAFT_500382 [Pseudovirgaria hyperparasitica]|uniref:Uncharacterized protein n=1 Tax=Pseudovirgaria hyperparasitica TaxID=470096 RepID=A0A6A6W5H4_9PEZI|nr:uncharacterized protein EJ05DRAFT_500382 [Pseudovirgaria hyperparasitica]KAF2757853.1 hypothetical protein EJ05DRAFT_500382 [Pseudovirgaria hyperparasitica]